MTAPIHCLATVSRLGCREGGLERAWKSLQVEDGAGRPGKPRQLEFAWQNIRGEPCRTMLEMGGRCPSGTQWSAHTGEKATQGQRGKNHSKGAEGILCCFNSGDNVHAYIYMF